MAHCGLGSIPGCHMWVKFVVGSRPCSKDSCFSESSGFPPSAKKKNKQTNKQAKNKKTIQIRPGSRGQEEPPRGMAAAKFSFPFPLFPLFSELCVPTPLPRRFKW